MASGSTEADFYVAPDGNDQWSGTLPDATGNAADGPFASLTRARDAVRTLRAHGRTGSIRVLIRGGRYDLADTVVFGIEDGAIGATDTVTYAAYPGEAPIFSSGIPITGWRPLDDWHLPLPVQAREKVWVADLPKGLGRFYSLYDGDRRLPRARTEGFTPTEPTLEPAQLWALTGTVLGHGLDLDTTLRFPPGAMRAWDNLEDVELVIRPNYPWVLNILGLASVDTETRVACTTLPGTYPLRQLYGHMTESTDRIASAWVENVLEGLSGPGQWVLDTRRHRLYLWPLTDTPGPDIRAPRLRELIRIEGRIDVAGPVDEPVRGIVLEGLSFTEGDRDVWLAGDAGTESDFELVDKPNALVRLRGAERCAVIGCRFFNSGGTGLRLDLHCQDNEVEQNELGHLGATGIALIGYGPGTKDVNKHNRVSDNHIHHCGEIYWHSIGIVIANSGGNTISHNDLHHLPRGAIQVFDARPHFFDRRLPVSRECARMIRWDEIGDLGWEGVCATWSDVFARWDQVMPYLHSRDNVIELNEISRTNGFGGDSACIDLSGAGEGNVVRRNWIHDIPNPNIHGAIRTDDYQRGTLVEQNVIVRTHSGGLMIRLSNQWINNVIVDVDPTTYVWLGQQPLDGTVIRHNIFFHPGAEAPGFGVMWRPAGMNPYDRLAEARPGDVDHNIYFSTGSDAASAHLAALQQRGLDLASAAVDPGFVDWQNGDFRLAPGSPALAMGIQSVDIREAGLTVAVMNRPRS